MNLNRLKLSVFIVFAVFAVFTFLPVQKNTIAQTDEKNDILNLVADYKNDASAGIAQLEEEIKGKVRAEGAIIDFENRVDLLSNQFYQSLRAAYPDLPNTEVRFCSLIRLNMDNSEIASLQNISLSSVHTSRYRLKKSLNLGPEESLDQFIQNF